MKLSPTLRVTADYANPLAIDKNPLCGPGHALILHPLQSMKGASEYLGIGPHNNMEASNQDSNPYIPRSLKETDPDEDKQKGKKGEGCG